MTPDFLKHADGLLPVIVQDADTKIVLMQAYMDEAAYLKTLLENKVTFFSRSKNRLWTKGESSGNFLEVKEILLDCDNDSILIKALPTGPVCHTGADTCFGEKNPYFSLLKLENIISGRKEQPSNSSYISRLFAGGINKIAQKVGEEAVELVIESKDADDDKFLNEAADLLFHYLILLKEKNHSLSDVIKILAGRHK
jgi:phosphoribosyl-ATP pyrophosphohydrolase/phosphoribosyl-AMP cyclohydrolase